MALGAIALAAGALGACSDDEADPTSQADYDEAAEALCEDYGDSVLIDANTLLALGESDAEIVAFLRTEYVPNIRSIVRGLDRVGLPERKASEYREGLNDVAAALTELDDETEAYALVDRIRANALDSDENPLSKVAAGMEQAEVECGRQAPDF